MILIADSGSTKAEWVIVDDNRPGKSFFTGGISPIYLTREEIIALLRKEMPQLAGLRFTNVFFYGSGCNSVPNNNRVSESIKEFIGVDTVYVGSDVLGAARSLCLDKPGIACILGTGSNSCYYDGNEIIRNVSPLGYILGDEGSAAVIGKKLISGILKNQLPEMVIKLFFETYSISEAEIIDNVYRKPFPSRYLGQFAKFISANIQLPDLEKIIALAFDEFVERNVLQYSEAKTCPVHFTGSIAYSFKPQLESCLKRYHLTPGIISLSPMANLINYHLNSPIKI